MGRNAKHDPDDVDFSIRLKHGVHTIFLFIDPLAPFSQITNDLLEILRERYPDGLTTSIAPPKTTPVPDSTRSVRVSFAVPKNPNNPQLGWRDLGVSESDRPVDKGLKDNAMVAFALQSPDDAEETTPFEVVWPNIDEEDGLAYDPERTD